MYYVLCGLCAMCYLCNTEHKQATPLLSASFCPRPNFSYLSTVLESITHLYYFFFVGYNNKESVNNPGKNLNSRLKYQSNKQYNKFRRFRVYLMPLVFFACSVNSKLYKSGPSKDEWRRLLPERGHDQK